MSEHVFPWWLGYLEGGWLRTLVDPPQGIVGPHLRPGQTALDVGSGMGFFTLAMARMVGPAGKVVAVDIEPRALAVLARRAKRAGLEARVLVRSCKRESLGLDEFRGRVDFALAFSVVHEVPDRDRLAAELSKVLTPEGRLLIVEHPGRVSAEDFQATLDAAGRQGMAVLECPGTRGRRDRSALLGRADSQDRRVHS